MATKIESIEAKIKRLQTELREAQEAERKRRERELVTAARKSGLLDLPSAVLEHEFQRIMERQAAHQSDEVGGIA